MLRGERERAVLRGVSMVAAGAALVLLVWAVGLAWWSRVGAMRALGDGRWEQWLLSTVPVFVPAGALVVVVAAVCTFLRRHRDGRGLLLFWCAVLVLVVLGSKTSGVLHAYRDAMDDRLVGVAVPAVVAAWVLCGVGVVMALLAAPAVGRISRAGIRVRSGGAAVAVVVALTATVVAVRIGDDGRYADSTTTAEVEMVKPPTALGRQAFTVSVPDAFWGSDNRNAYQIFAAGPGFVVYRDGRITSYGSDGAERWHYARTGPGDVKINWIRVVDDGTAVVARLDDHGVVGIDAMTGAQLWQSADLGLQEAVKGGPGWVAAPLLMLWGEGKPWTRYDGRTGRELWTVDPPHVGCGSVEPSVMPTRVVSVVECPTGEVWLTAVDAATGETVWDTALVKDVPRPEQRPAEGYFDVWAYRANQVGVVVDSSGLGSPGAPMYANVVEKTVTTLPGKQSLSETGGATDDFVRWDYGDHFEKLLTLFTADAHLRCETSTAVDTEKNRVPMTWKAYGDDLAMVAYPDTFVVADGDQHALRVFDSTTCVETGQVPVSGEVQGFVPIPGATLVLRREGGTLQIDGYRAA